MTRTQLLTGLAATLLAGLSGVTSAAPIVFFGEDASTAGTGPGANSAAARASFVAGLTGVGTEDFEGQTLGATAPLALSFPGSVGTLGATLTGGGVVDNNASAGSGGGNPGRFATSGDQFWEASSGSFSINFDSPISAFGFYGTDIGDFVNSRMVITLTAVGGATTPLTVGHSLNLANNANASLFWGFIDTAITYESVTFTNPGGGDTFAFDDMTIGDAQQVIINRPVPEPSTLALVALSTLAAGAAGRRRSARRQAQRNPG